MTNKEAIFKLIEYRRRLERDFKGFDAEPFDMAIKTLEQQPCEDCISREAVLDKWKNTTLRGRTEFDQVIMMMPPVTPQPKTGRWIFDEILDKHYYCSECKSMGVDYWDFCPNCGAKMEVSE